MIITTGTCATAAAVAATIRLLEGRRPDEVPVLLPDDETIHVAVAYGEDYASVIKDAGDDPDVTNGIEIRASVEPSDTFEIVGGKEALSLLQGHHCPLLCPLHPAVRQRKTYHITH